MTCGQQQTANGEIVSAKCILNSKHTGPHTDGDKMWNDSEPETLDSNYDIAAKEGVCNCGAFCNNQHAVGCPLYKGTGYISFIIAGDVFWACPDCGAITNEPALHSKWHSHFKKL